MTHEQPSGKPPEKLIPGLLREGMGVLTIGWDLAIPIVGGVLLGHALDRWLGTTYLFTLGLLVLGVMGAYYNLLRLIRRLNEKDRRSSDSDEEGDV